MTKHDVPVVRIVVEGCPAARSSRTNVPQARDILLRAFVNYRWPGKVMFAITPGGFIAAPFPTPWKGASGWASGPDDFQALVEHAKAVVGEVLTPRVLQAARGRVEFLTLGVDLNDAGGKRKMDRTSRGTHAELVAIIDVEKGAAVQWTGKSYPVFWQEPTLVQEVNLNSHLFECGKHRVLVLGCHDLNMFSERARANMTTGSPRHTRSEDMRTLTRDFGPTMILHHPHSTDSPRVWATPWKGARAFFPESDDRRHIWASGIGYYNDEEEPRGALQAVQCATRCCGSHVVDIVVKPPRRAGADNRAVSRPVEVSRRQTPHRGRSAADR